MFCEACGNQLEIGNKFCKNCGTKVTPISQPLEEKKEESQPIAPVVEPVVQNIPPVAEPVVQNIPPVVEPVVQNIPPVAEPLANEVKEESGFAPTSALTKEQVTSSPVESVSVEQVTPPVHPQRSIPPVPPEMPQMQKVAQEKRESGEKKKKSKKFLWVILELLIFIGALSFLYVSLLFVHSPKKYGETFFLHLANGDYKKAFSMMDKKRMEESEFLNEEALASYADFVGATGVSDYAIKSSDSEEKVEIHFTSGNEEKELSFAMKKSDKKSFFFFPTWMVDPDEMIASDVKVNLPAFSQLELDEVKISDEKTGEEFAGGDLEMKTLKIPPIFKGKHMFVLLVDKDIQKKGVFYKTEMELKKRKETLDFYQIFEKKSAMQKFAEKTLEATYYALAMEENAGNILSYFSGDIREKISGRFDEIKRNFGLIESISLSNIEVFGDQNTSNILLQFDVEIHYANNYTGNTWEKKEIKEKMEVTFVLEEAGDSYLVKDYDFLEFKKLGF